MELGLELGKVEAEEVLSLLECPVCLDHITPPVRQCLKGHLICSDCFPRLHHCPTCRGDMCQERNLAMEQVAGLLQFPCRYHPMGCREAFPLTKKEAHERDCPFLQLKCPFHGQCAFNGSLADVVPHLASEHSVTPVPVQPNGRLFYRAKNFYRRNLWALIFSWDGNLFRLMVKHVHSSQVGRPENCNLLIAHIQYIGPDSMAAKYSYSISLFDTETRRTNREFSGVVTSTMKPLESQCGNTGTAAGAAAATAGKGGDGKGVFVATFHQARNYTDQWANLNFIILMKKLDEGRGSGDRNNNAGAQQTSSAAAPIPTPGPSGVAVTAATSSTLSSAAPQPSSSSSGTAAVAAATEVEPMAVS